ncbi:MAG: hypothetical protein RBU30_03760 [Polyangia bacterium]|nr:hypothetical protein [Polyangia bacterium]
MTVHNEESAGVREAYGARMARFAEEAARLGLRSRRIAHLRLAIFACFSGSLLLGLWPFPQVGWGWISASGGFLLLFIFLVGRHDRVIRQERRAAVTRDLCEEALARLDRRWDALAPRVAPKEAARAPLSRDLDLFGEGARRASLFDLLGTPHTPMGRQTLAEWLLEPASPAVVRARQEAVRELAPLLDFRQDFGVRGRQMLSMPSGVEPFLAWAEGEPWMLGRAHRVWIPRVLTFVTILLLVLGIAGLLPPWWLLGVALNLLYTAVAGRRAHGIFDQVARRERAFREFEGLFSPIAQGSFQALGLQSLVLRLFVDGQAAHSQMRRMDRIMGMADARRTGLMYLLVQGLLLWDFHVLYALSRWQRGVGRKVRDWFAVLGEVEALMALAALAHDEPSWCFPELVDPGRDAALRARALGHPLLPLDGCIRNDVSVGPTGSFLLVTGSNMSGKSTLLRAIGVNAVLAQVGGPVCAESFSMPPLRLGTSFRLEDSIEQGVSFFMAELRRLKTIVDEASSLAGYGTDRAEMPASGEGEREWMYLFLLDEILQGTNVYERQIAVRHVLCHLMRRGAIGAISSHDLTLAESEGLTEAARPVHFTEDYRVEPKGPRMTFDYRLRPGVAPTTNALKLLELVGLGEAVSSQGGPPQTSRELPCEPAGGPAGEPAGGRS